MEAIIVGVRGEIGGAGAGAGAGCCVTTRAGGCAAYVTFFDVVTRRSWLEAGWAGLCGSHGLDSGSEVSC